MESIAHLPELSNLIDELYFDYHFYTGIGGDHFGGDSACLSGSDAHVYVYLLGAGVYPY